MKKESKVEFKRVEIGEVVRVFTDVLFLMLGCLGVWGSFLFGIYDN